jgi:hypothetical protein
VAPPSCGCDSSLGSDESVAPVGFGCRGWNLTCPSGGGPPSGCWLNILSLGGACVISILLRPVVPASIAAGGGGMEVKGIGSVEPLATLLPARR